MVDEKEAGDNTVGYLAWVSTDRWLTPDALRRATPGGRATLGAPEMQGPGLG